MQIVLDMVVNSLYLGIQDNQIGDVMKLTYWLAECLNDSTAYNIRRKTRRAVTNILADHDRSRYGPVRKVAVEYSDGFDLLNQCMGEGREQRNHMPRSWTAKAIRAYVKERGPAIRPVEPPRLHA